MKLKTGIAAISVLSTAVFAQGMKMPVQTVTAGKVVDKGTTKGQ